MKPLMQMSRERTGRGWMEPDPEAPEPPFWLKCAVVALPLLFVVVLSLYNGQ